MKTWSQVYVLHLEFWLNLKILLVLGNLIEQGITISLILNFDILCLLNSLLNGIATIAVFVAEVTSFLSVLYVSIFCCMTLAGSIDLPSLPLFKSS